MALVRKAMESSCGTRPRSAAHGVGDEKGEYVSEDDDDDDSEGDGEVDKMWRMDTGDIEDQENMDYFEHNKK